MSSLENISVTVLHPWPACGTYMCKFWFMSYHIYKLYCLCLTLTFDPMTLEMS